MKKKHNNSKSHKTGTFWGHMGDVPTHTQMVDYTESEWEEIPWPQIQFASDHSYQHTIRDMQFDVSGHVRFTIPLSPTTIPPEVGDAVFLHGMSLPIGSLISLDVSASVANANHQIIITCTIMTNSSVMLMLDATGGDANKLYQHLKQKGADEDQAEAMMAELGILKDPHGQYVYIVTGLPRVIYAMQHAGDGRPATQRIKAALAIVHSTQEKQAMEAMMGTMNDALEDSATDLSTAAQTTAAGVAAFATTVQKLAESDAGSGVPPKPQVKVATPTAKGPARRQRTMRNLGGDREE